VEQIAQVYARSLFEVAQEGHKLDLVREQLGQIDDAIRENREMRLFLFSPYFSTQEKREGLRRAIVDADPAISNILDVLLENHRLPVISRIRREYDRLWDQANDLLAVTVTSAVELDEAVVQRIGDEIGRQTGRRVELSRQVDASILGGFVVRVGNAILDSSVRNRLEQLRKEVARA
jgi:ATP synthase F1 delta subunit